MKSRILVLLTGFFFLFFSSCKKINQTTELGDDLIPVVDNVNTFEAFLTAETDNRRLDDSSRLFYSDNVAIGDINDPVFGHTEADAYFQISYTGSPPFSPTKNYPFYNRDSVLSQPNGGIDSVILSLDYRGTYGDTFATVTMRVSEISPTAGINDTSLYKFTEADFPKASLLGSKTFEIRSLNDTILHVRNGDTTKLVNELRIPLTNALGTRLVNFDTTFSANGAYYNDSLFKKALRGFALETNGGENALNYFNLAAGSKTKLTVYYRVRRNGVDSSTSATFVHVNRTNLSGGEANIIKRTEGGDWATYLNNGNPLDDKLFIQTTPGRYTGTPSGSFASIKIPQLDTFSNAIIHRADLIVTRLPSTSDNIFTPPALLLLDKISPAGDTAFTFEYDMNAQIGLSQSNIFVGTFDPTAFGGKIKGDTYKFNLTRHVQKIITNKDPNYSLRLYAPLRTFLYDRNYNRKGLFTILSQVANGRVVLAGGNYSDPSLRLRLRVVYSKIN